MFCVHCGAQLGEGSSFCSQCGRASTQTDPQVTPEVAVQPASAVQLNFEGTGLQLLGWILLAVIGVLLVIPVAWVTAAIGRWTCRNVRFSDGTRANFTGTGGEVFGWCLLAILLLAALIAAQSAAAEEGFGVTLLISLVYTVINSAIALKIVSWFVSRIQLSSGPPLRFTGGYGLYVGYSLLVQVSIYTIVGWAWAVAAFYRWLCRNVAGQGLEVRFTGSGGAILWRTLVVVLVSLLIIPLPWICVWFLRWLVQKVSLTRSAETAPAGA